MQFIITAHDCTDEGALERRLAARDAHIQYTNSLIEHFICGVALLNDRGDMAGSVLIADFQDREAVDKWLENEPYVKGKVWEHIDVQECRVGPSFLKN